MAKDVLMGPYLWCAIGAVLGWLASLATMRGFVPTVESVCVGIFGAFLGGEFLPAYVLVPQAGDKGLSGAAIAMAVVSAVVCLVLLKLMRGAVGPLKAKKARRSS